MNFRHPHNVFNMEIPSSSKDPPFFARTKAEAKNSSKIIAPHNMNSLISTTSATYREHCSRTQRMWARRRRCKQVIKPRIIKILFRWKNHRSLGLSRHHSPGASVFLLLIFVRRRANRFPVSHELFFLPMGSENHES